VTYLTRIAGGRERRAERVLLRPVLRDYGGQVAHSGMIKKSSAEAIELIEIVG
jgi:hypothetical protein